MASPGSQGTQAKPEGSASASSQTIGATYRGHVKARPAETDEDRDLLNNAWSGTKASIDSICKLGANLNCCDEPKGRTPLLRSIEGNDDESVALLLIERGADINCPEYAGRTPLMQCIWKDRITVFDALIEKADINVEMKDQRERNVLHHLVRDMDRVAGNASRKTMFDKKSTSTRHIFTKLIEKNASIINVKDEYDRTCLHWLCLHGNDDLVKLLVKEAQLDEHAPFKVDYQGRSALHIAAAKEHFNIVSTLLAKIPRANGNHYDHINDKSLGDWTILLLILRSPKAPLSLVKDLVEHGADINSCVQDGKNALHLAALNGNYELVKYMLEQPTMHRSKRDEFGDTPLLCAARCKHLDVDETHKLLKLFAPWNDLFRPEHDTPADRAARNLNLRPVIYEFDRVRDPKGKDAWREMETSTPLTVHDVIYATDPDFPDQPALRTMSTDKSFKWIHLPANSITWCLDLVSKHFIEHSAKGDVHGLQELERSFAHHERHNKNPHFSYMTPICETISKFDDGTAIVGRPPLSASGFNAESFLIDESNSRRSSAGGTVTSPGGLRSSLRPHLPRASTLFNFDNTLSWQVRPSRNTKVETAQSTAQEDAEGPINAEQTSISSMYLFMPYIHHEITLAQRQMFELATTLTRERNLVLDGNATASKDHVTSQADSLSKENAKQPPGQKQHIDLLLAHSISADRNTLHLRRTLDQYGYQHIDTQERDVDQVFQRDQVAEWDPKHQQEDKMCRRDPNRPFHCCQRAHFSEQEHTSIRVQALWSYLGYDQNKALAQGHLCKLCNCESCHKTSEVEPLESLMVDQLWMLVLRDDLVITSFPAAWRADGRQSDMLRRVIDFIRSNNNNEVGSVYELSQLIVGQFYGSYRRFASEEKYEFLNTYKDALGQAKDKEVKMLKAFIPDPPATSAHLKKLTKVAPETDLLKEVKDIADELGILDMVLAAQEHVHLQMIHAVDAWIEHEDAKKKQRAYKMSMDHQRAIDLPREEVGRMLGQSAQIEASILALLDLKQKHANALQAYATGRSGTIIMIFTIVTIIFLPLTFISSFFTIEIAEFPRDETGVSMPASYVMTFVLGVGAPIATALVIMALFAEYTNDKIRGLWQTVKPSEESKIENKLSIEREAEAKLALPKQSSFRLIKRSATYDLEEARVGDENRSGASRFSLRVNGTVKAQ